MSFILTPETGKVSYSGCTAYPLGGLVAHFGSFGKMVYGTVIKNQEKMTV